MTLYHVGEQLLEAEKANFPKYKMRVTVDNTLSLCKECPLKDLLGWSNKNDQIIARQVIGLGCAVIQLDVVNLTRRVSY